MGGVGVAATDNYDIHGNISSNSKFKLARMRSPFNPSTLLQCPAGEDSGICLVFIPKKGKTHSKENQDRIAEQKRMPVQPVFTQENACPQSSSPGVSPKTLSLTPMIGGRDSFPP